VLFQRLGDPIKQVLLEEQLLADARLMGHSAEDQLRFLLTSTRALSGFTETVWLPDELTRGVYHGMALLGIGHGAGNHPPPLFSTLPSQLAMHGALHAPLLRKGKARHSSAEFGDLKALTVAIAPLVEARTGCPVKFALDRTFHHFLREPAPKWSHLASLLMAATRYTPVEFAAQLALHVISRRKVPLLQPLPPPLQFEMLSICQKMK